MFELLTQGFLLFLAYVAVHLVLCRLSAQQFVAKAAILFLIFVMGSALIAFMNISNSFVDILIYELNFYFLWAIYIIVLVNAQNSFSLGALQIFLENGGNSQGLNLDSIFAIDSSLDRRLDILKLNSLVTEDADGIYQLTPKGQFLAKVGIFLRKALRITETG